MAVTLREYAIVMPAKLKPGRTTFVLRNRGVFPHNFTAIYGPVTQWSTSRIDLTWHSGQWLVTGVRSHGGPSTDSSLQRLASTVRRFREVRYVP